MRLADSLHEAVRELARRDNLSINRFTPLALAEKVSALMTEEYLSGRGSRGKFEKALDEVADVEADAGDRLSE